MPFSKNENEREIDTSMDDLKITLSTMYTNAMEFCWFLHLQWYIFNERQYILYLHVCD